MAEGIIANKPAQYILLADYEVTGSAVTNVDFTGLNISKDEEVVLVANSYNAVSSPQNDLQIYVNGNTTSSNYYSQYLIANSTSVGASRSNSAQFMNIDPFKNTFNITNIKLTNNGYFVFQAQNNYAYGISSTLIYNWYGTSTFTVTSITSLRIAGTTNAIGIGSRFQLYRIAE